jgi:hypothetical protein
MDLQLTFNVCISLKWEPKEEEPGSCRRPTSCVRQVLLVIDEAPNMQVLVSWPDRHGCGLGVILGQALGSKQAMKLHLEHLSSFRSGFSKASKRDSRRKQFGTQERVSTVLKVTCL